jgi:hypothetical protein
MLWTGASTAKHLLQTAASPWVLPQPPMGHQQPGPAANAATPLRLLHYLHEDTVIERSTCTSYDRLKGHHRWMRLLQVEQPDPLL